MRRFLQATTVTILKSCSYIFIFMLRYEKEEGAKPESET